VQSSKQAYKPSTGYAGCIYFVVKLILVSFLDIEVMLKFRNEKDEKIIGKYKHSRQRLYKNAIGICVRIITVYCVFK